MDTKFITLSEILELYTDEIQATFSEEQAQRVLNETRSAIYRFLLPKIGFQKTNSGRKMTAADIQAAEEFTQTVTVLRLRQARGLVAQAFDQAEVSVATRNTYGSRLNQFLSWVETQSWYPCERMLRIQNQCRPARRLSGRRRIGELPLTSRTGFYTQYSLRPEETPEALQKELADLNRFMLDANYSGRVVDSISQRTATSYSKEIRLLLGFLAKHKEKPIPLDKLALSALVPFVTTQDLDGLSSMQQKDLWRSKEIELQDFICEYFNFIRTENSAISPRTLVGKLTAFKRVATYLYRYQVRTKKDYRAIPIFITLDEEISKVVKIKKRWEKNRQYVANQEYKWITPVEGETVLTTLRREILIPMRLECRPRRKNGSFREPAVIARSMLHYLKWAFLLDFPPRRQQDYRTTQIALTCPIIKPDSVPSDGFYFPMPPQEEREKNYDGTTRDNYLYKAYQYKGKQYPEGIWILELTSYKTDRVYGIYEMKLSDRTFEDGSQFYQYLESYLCGLWLPEGKKNLQIYDWWDSQLKGKRGRWVTKGRAEFSPQDDHANRHRSTKSIWRSGYLFPVPKTGQQADGSSFGGSFSRTSYQLIGKRITPHMLRYVWATWAFQVGLSNAELESLAYSMGHSLSTLRAMYERCTPEEKLRPILEAIDRHLFQQWEDVEVEEKSEERSSPKQLATLVQEINQLSAMDRQELLKLFG